MIGTRGMMLLLPPSLAFRHEIDFSAAIQGRCAGQGEAAGMNCIVAIEDERGHGYLRRRQGGRVVGDWMSSLRSSAQRRDRFFLIAAPALAASSPYSRL